jgi:hypothetical protein
MDKGSDKCTNIMLDIVHCLSIFDIHYILGVVIIPTDLLLMFYKYLWQGLKLYTGTLKF